MTVDEKYEILLKKGLLSDLEKIAQVRNMKYFCDYNIDYCRISVGELELVLKNDSTESLGVMYPENSSGLVSATINVLKSMMCSNYTSNTRE
jgi:hypothetical protein